MMSKLSQQEEKELIAFVKNWLKAHGFTQKFKELHKKGGIFNIVKNLIMIEQNWLNNIQDISEEVSETKPYNQLNLIDSVLNQINKDISE